MTEWRLGPRGSIEGPVRLGMSLEEVKQALGSKYDSFRRTREAKNDVLAFDTHGVHVVIDAENGKVAGIIIFSPNRVWLAGMQLLDEQASALRQALQKKGIPFETDEVGLWNATMNVCLVTADGLIDGVQIGASG